MLVSLDCPIADVSAHDLGVAFDGPLPQILVDRTLTSGDTSLHLGIIGASHVATVTHRSGTFREEISCFAGEPGSLTSQARGRYELRVDLRRHPDFEARAAQIVAQVAADEWLSARFPGEGDFHLTALTGRCRAGWWEWDTFHLYPEEKIIVSTASRYQI